MKKHVLLRKQYADRIRQSKWALTMAVIITLCIAIIAVMVGLTNLKGQAGQYAGDVQIDYDNMIRAYCHTFNAAYERIVDKIREDPSFEEMDAWLKSQDDTFSKAMGEDIYDGIAITYKGGYAHSWNYGDYSDYDATSRRWYQVAAEAGGETAIVPPYVTYLDAQFLNDDSYILMSVVRKYNDTIFFDYDIRIKEIKTMLQNRKQLYTGIELLMYDKDGYILSSSDNEKFAHNLYKPDTVISSSLSKTLKAAEKKHGLLRLSSIDGKWQYLYLDYDDNGNAICMSIPFTAVFWHDFGAILLVLLFMLGFEFFLYRCFCRSLIAFNNRDKQLTAITHAIFLRRLYVNTQTMTFDGEQDWEARFEDHAFSKLFSYLLVHIPEKNEQDRFSAFVSPDALRASDDPLYTLNSEKFSIDWDGNDDLSRLSTIEFSRMFSVDNGKKTACLLIRDISEDAAILKEALARAESASRAKSDFLSRVSHDIRTPMNTILNLTQMVEAELDDKEAATEDLHKIETSNRFLLSLVNDILDMSRIEQKSITLHPERYSYREFVNYMQSTFEPLSQEKHIAFTIDAAQPYPDVCIDKVRFNQLCFNLVSNAIKYTEAGGNVCFRMTRGEIADGAFPCDLYVIDNGIGMSKAFQEKMFEPFAQEGRAFASVEGTGLGLSIVKEIADLLGASIEVKSAEGEGTTFHIHIMLPLMDDEPSAKPPKTVSLDILNGCHVLIAEDHPLNQEIVCRLLLQVGVSA